MVDWLKAARLTLWAIQALPEKDRPIFRGPNRMELKRLQRILAEADQDRDIEPEEPALSRTPRAWWRPLHRWWRDRKGA